MHDVEQSLVERIRRLVVVIEQIHDRVADFSDVMRRNVGRHPDGNPGGTVDEQLRQPRREDDRLGPLIVEVGDEIDRVFFDVGEHFERDAGQPRLGVAVGRRRVAVDRAKVSVAVDERIAQGKGLGHPHERVVHRAIAVRVVAFEDLADDARALAVLFVRRQVHLAHCVEDAALHRFETVPDVGKRARHDDRHRIREVALAHFVFDVDLGSPISIQYST